MSSGLQSLETLDAAGKRLAKQDFASTYEFEWNSSAVGRIRPDGGWDLAMVTRDGVLHCFDAATCRARWTFDLGCKATLPINVMSGDIDSDGRDNFLVGLPDGTLLSLDERDGRGEVLWRLTFDSGIRDTIIGDLDADARAEVVVETEDGAVRVLKAMTRD
jgi:outer membrane protein assembly factor BamB